MATSRELLRHLRKWCDRIGDMPIKDNPAKAELNDIYGEMMNVIIKSSKPKDLNPWLRQ